MSWYVHTLITNADSISSLKPEQEFGSVMESEEILKRIIPIDMLTIFKLLNLPLATSIENEDEIDKLTWGILGIDSDFYNDLLILSKKIKDLYLSGNISKYEVLLISSFMDGDEISVVGNEYGIKDIRTLKKDFYNVCNKLAFALGGEFTDEGYLNYMIEKYKLNSEQAQLVLQFMEKDRR